MAALPLSGMAAGSAGHAVSRLLLVEPDLAVLDRFGDPAGRASWPLHDEASHAALAVIAEGFAPTAVIEEWRALLGDGEDALDLRQAGPAGGPLVAELEALYAAEGGADPAFAGTRADHLGLQLRHLAQLGVALDVARRDGGDAAAVVAAIDAARARVDGFGPALLASLGERAETAPLCALPGLAAGFLDSLDRVCRQG